MSESGVRGFFGQHFYLSNFFDGEGRVFGCPTVEHFYQSMKTTDLRERQMVQDTPTPTQAKKLGRLLTLRPDWELIKVDVMRFALAEKFQFRSIVAEKLRETTGYLEETNDWGDRFWGVCNGSGHNMLGRLLMDRRVILQETRYQETRYPDAPLRFDFSDRRPVSEGGHGAWQGDE